MTQHNGINIPSNPSWKPHNTEIAKSASRNFGVLFKCQRFFSYVQLLQLYKELVHPFMEYCSHILGCCNCIYLTELRLVQSSLSTLNLISKLDKVFVHHSIYFLSLFYGYFLSFCFQELAAPMPPPLIRPCSIVKPLHHLTTLE